MAKYLDNGLMSFKAINKLLEDNGFLSHIGTRPNSIGHFSKIYWSPSCPNIQFNLLGKVDYENDNERGVEILFMNAKPMYNYREIDNFLKDKFVYDKKIGKEKLEFYKKNGNNKKHKDSHSSSVSGGKRK